MKSAFLSALDEQSMIDREIERLAFKELPKHRPTTKVYDKTKAKIKELEGKKWESYQRGKAFGQKMDTLRKLAIANRLIGFE